MRMPSRPPAGAQEWGRQEKGKQDALSLCTLAGDAAHPMSPFKGQVRALAYTIAY